jgi:DNA topoisomerase-1
MTTIQDREYVEKIESRFHPTPLGTTVNDLLIASFDDIFNTAYTARMEEELDEIEEGKLAWQDALRGFYGKFSKDLAEATESIKNKKKMSIPTDEICEKCGSEWLSNLKVRPVPGLFDISGVSEYARSFAQDRRRWCRRRSRHRRKFRFASCAGAKWR